MGYKLSTHTIQVPNCVNNPPSVTSKQLSSPLGKGVKENARRQTKKGKGEGPNLLSQATNGV